MNHDNHDLLGRCNETDYREPGYETGYEPEVAASQGGYEGAPGVGYEQRSYKAGYDVGYQRGYDAGRAAYAAKNDYVRSGPAPAVQYEGAVAAGYEARAYEAGYVAGYAGGYAAARAEYAAVTGYEQIGNDATSYGKSSEYGGSR